MTIEGYIVTPYILGRSLDLNGTVILIACLFWGFLWGLVGLVLAMPITACIKLVFQNIPELHRWADLMSRDWQPPARAQVRRRPAPLDRPAIASIGEMPPDGSDRPTQSCGKGIAMDVVLEYCAL